MKKLFDYIEIKTKITSLMTFTLVILLLMFHEFSIQTKETIVFFIGMFLFDLTTTTINNYIDSKTNEEDFQMSRKTLKIIMWTLFGLSVLMGLWLVYLTHWIVLVLGMISFFIGIIYTFGPMAISRTPFGEVVSGALYGYMIPLILVIINLKDDFLKISYDGLLHITLNPKLVLGFIIFGLVPFLLTAGIMLGNNICDLNEDIKVNRFTLVYYLNQDKSTQLLMWLYRLTYISILLGIVFKIYPHWIVFSLFSAPLAFRNIKEFAILKDKQISFPNVIKNFIMIMMSLILIMLIMNLS